MKYLAMHAQRDIDRHAAIFDRLVSSMGETAKPPPLELLTQAGETDAEILTLFYEKGYHIREIAGMLDITENAVKCRLVKARKNLEITAREKNLLKKL